MATGWSGPPPLGVISRVPEQFSGARRRVLGAQSGKVDSRHLPPWPGGERASGAVTESL